MCANIKYVKQVYILKMFIHYWIWVVCNHVTCSYSAEKLPERPGGSQPIDRWFSNSRDVKSGNGHTDFTSKPEATNSSEGKSDGIWGDFDSDSVSDAVLLTAADAVEQREIKIEQSRPDGELHFPGQGQKLGEAPQTSVPPGSIVRRIPGIGVISGRSVIDNSTRQDGPFTKSSLNAATTSLSQRQSLSHISISDSASGNWTASSASPVKFESIAEFRKTVGMVLSPPGTEVRVKNFVSVCNRNRNGRPLPSRHDPLAAPQPKSGRSVSGDDSDIRPVKKMRLDTEATLLNNAGSGDSKKSASNTHPNNLALQLDRSSSVAGEDDDIILVNSDSESRVENSKQLWQTQGEELNARWFKGPSTAHGIGTSSFDAATPSDTDQAVGGIEIDEVLEQTGCVECPVCHVSILADIINEHLDQCLM